MTIGKGPLERVNVVLEVEPGFDVRDFAQGARGGVARVDENLALYKTLQNYFYSENMPPIGTQIAYIMLLLNKYSGILAQGKKPPLIDLPSITFSTTSSHT